MMAALKGLAQGVLSMLGVYIFQGLLSERENYEDYSGFSLTRRMNSRLSM